MPAAATVFGGVILVGHLAALVVAYASEYDRSIPNDRGSFRLSVILFVCVRFVASILSSSRPTPFRFGARQLCVQIVMLLLNRKLLCLFVLYENKT